MQSLADTLTEYLESLPDDRKEVIQKLREVIFENLSEGFMETMSYGIIGYVVPHLVLHVGTRQFSYD